jgi:hypothetical protein
MSSHLRLLMYLLCVSNCLSFYHQIPYHTCLPRPASDYEYYSLVYYLYIPEAYSDFKSCSDYVGIVISERNEDLRVIEIRDRRGVISWLTESSAQLPSLASLPGQRRRRGYTEFSPPRGPQC